MQRTGLLVSSTGGHLEQIQRLSRRFAPRFDRLDFATFDDAQSRSLLAGRTVHHVRNIPPRAAVRALRTIPRALSIIRRGGYTDVISTGAAIAVPFLLAARIAGVRAHYIESAARSHGPSLTGRIVSRCIPGTHLYCQYRSWADDRWTYAGAVFDGLAPAPLADPPAKARRVVVTFGTIGYPFPRAVEAIQRILPEVAEPDAEILWQLGSSVDSGPEGAVDMIPAKELRKAIKQADLVIAHAGVGSCLQILSARRTPVLLPRRSASGEHVDDHQEMIAEDLNARGLAVMVDPDDLTPDYARRAMSHTTKVLDKTIPFELVSR